MSGAVLRRHFSVHRNQRARSWCLGAMDQEVDQQGDGSTGAALLRAAEPGSPRHVEVSPFKILGELPQKGCGGTGAALAAADVGDVREVALELIDVFLSDRQPPSAIIGANSGGCQFLSQRFVVAHQAAGMIAESD